LQNKNREYYDVAIVGAGPAGATTAYYLAKGGAKVLLLEKKQFPRDKFCGDAVCKTAIEILIDMGIYDKLIKENKAHIVRLSLPFLFLPRERENSTLFSFFRLILVGW
jgi:flavin-dependent dehydrogenase